MDLGKHISDLLFDYDCIVIPGFGGFVANYAPAELHPTSHTVRPPYKKLTFNKQLTNNDGLLANHIAAQENKSFRQACDLISVEVKALQAKLENGERIKLPGIGEFFLDVEKNIRFEQDSSQNYLMEAFGLPTVQAHPIVRERKLEPVFESEKTTTEKRGVRRLMPYAAAASALLLFGVAIGVSLFSKGQYNVARMVNFPSGSEMTYTPRQHNSIAEADFLPENVAFYVFDLPEEAETLNYSFTKNKPVGSGSGIVVRARENANEEVTETGTVKKVERKNYHIIAGAFRSENNADELAQKLRKQGYDAGILQESTSLRKVAYGSYVLKSEAQEALFRIQREANSQAWIYKKKL